MTVGNESSGGEGPGGKVGRRRVGSEKPIPPQGCVEDLVSPIVLRVNFSLVGQPIPSAQNLRPVLAVGSQDLFTASVSLAMKSQGWVAVRVSPCA